MYDVAIFRKQASLWAAGEAERARGFHYHDSDKLRKMEKQDKLEKLEMMEGSDRVKHLEAQMLSKIRAMGLEPKMMEQLMDDEVCTLYFPSYEILVKYVLSVHL